MTPPDSSPALAEAPAPALPMTLTEHVVGLRRTLHRMLTRKLAERIDRPFLQLRLLRAVKRGKVRSQSEAAEHLLIDPAAVCRLVDRLEDEGLVQRCQGKDRRSGRLQVTEAAHPVIDVFNEDIRWLDGHVRHQLTADEYDTLVRLVVKLQTGLNDPAERLPPPG